MVQMVLLQFMIVGLFIIVVLLMVYCDYLILVKVGAKIDLGVVIDDNREVYDFFMLVLVKFGIGFWGLGSGIIY